MFPVPVHVPEESSAVSVPCTVEAEGPAELPVRLAYTVCAAKFDRLKVSDGVVLAVATLVVNSGERLPALKVVTVPPPPLVDWMQFAK
jgi:hypothetical protein